MCNTKEEYAAKCPSDEEIKDAFHRNFERNKSEFIKMLKHSGMLDSDIEGITEISSLTNRIEKMLELLSRETYSKEERVIIVNHQATELKASEILQAWATATQNGYWPPQSRTADSTQPASLAPNPSSQPSTICQYIPDALKYADQTMHLRELEGDIIELVNDLTRLNENAVQFTVKDRSSASPEIAMNLVSLTAGMFWHVEAWTHCRKNASKPSKRLKNLLKKYSSDTEASRIARLVQLLNNLHKLDNPSFYTAPENDTNTVYSLAIQLTTTSLLRDIISAVQIGALTRSHSETTKAIQREFENHQDCIPFDKANKILSDILTN